MSNTTILSSEQAQPWERRMDSWQVFHKKVVERAQAFDIHKKPNDSKLQVQQVEPHVGATE